MMSNILKSKGAILDIELVKCVHRYPNESAVGKTAIAHMALDDPLFQYKIVLIDRKNLYDSFLRGELAISSTDIVVFDRMDMYGTEKVWDLINKIDDVCILIDSKSLWCGTPSYTWAYCEWTDVGLKVRDDYTK